ncbi:MAG: cation transporter [Nitrospinae bacterium]|nr:cation transporter [Nitrospinota bacterium]
MASSESRHTGRLSWALGLTASFMVLEVVGGLWTGSLALLADAGHMLTDVGGLSLSLFALWFARKLPTPANTYGYVRTEILAVQVNGMMLFLVAGYILYEGFRRVWTPSEILGGPMLVIAVLGLGVNLLGMWLLHGGTGESLNLRGAYLELLSDALGSIGVILAAVIIQTTGFVLADPIISVLIGFFILPRTWELLRQAIHILMEGVPPHLDIRDIEAAMTTVHGVRAVHDLHVWTLTSGKYVMSGHAVVDNLAAGPQMLHDLHQLLHERFGIEHTTIQLESEPLLQIGAPPDHTFPSDRQGPSQQSGGA